MNIKSPQTPTIVPSVRYGVEITIPDTGEKIYVGELVRRRSAYGYELSLCYDEATGTWWIVTKAETGKTACASWPWEKRTSAWDTFLHATAAQIEAELLTQPIGHRN